MCLSRLLVFVLVGAVAALAVALVGVSSVALMAQASALVSQCVMGLALLVIGGVVVAQIVMRNRIAQIYVARKLFGDDAERMLRTAQQPETLTAAQLTQLPAAEHWPIARTQRSVETVRRPMMAPPVVPSGWGFDDEE